MIESKRSTSELEPELTTVQPHSMLADHSMESETIDHENAVDDDEDDEDGDSDEEDEDMDGAKTRRQSDVDMI